MQDATVIFAVGPLLVVLATASTDGIVAAHARADHDEVVRLAGQLGAAGLAPLLESGDRGLVAAGLAAAPGAPDAWELLDELAELAGGWDRSIAAPAARAAARIARTVDGDLAILYDLPDDQLAARQRSWAGLGGRADRWGDVRVHALEVAVRLATARIATATGDPGLGHDLAVTLGDADPEVRRVACELMPDPAPVTARPLLAAAVRDDADAAVALACAQALCAEIRHADAAPALAALGDDGLIRLRAIFKAPLPEVPGGALIDAARCLAAHRGKDDGPALRSLAAKVPRALRRALREVVQRKGSR